MPPEALSERVQSVMRRKPALEADATPQPLPEISQWSAEPPEERSMPAPKLLALEDRKMQPLPEKPLLQPRTEQLSAVAPPARMMPSPPQLVMLQLVTVAEGPVTMPAPVQ